MAYGHQLQLNDLRDLLKELQMLRNDAAEGTTECEAISELEPNVAKLDPGETGAIVSNEQTTVRLSKSTPLVRQCLVLPFMST
ncbi:hypothetical protein QYM46_07465 [Brevibacterium sp. K11IcPPYGO002]|uniref:hypothetical protein n=1 Tax=Brevibacterium sp. K11IcPPYGO002 TaxID=3058837 RepID=UPI003D816F35